MTCFRATSLYLVTPSSQENAWHLQLGHLSDRLPLLMMMMRLVNIVMFALCVPPDEVSLTKKTTNRIILTEISQNARRMKVTDYLALQDSNRPAFDKKCDSFVLQAKLVLLGSDLESNNVPWSDKPFHPSLEPPRNDPVNQSHY